MLLAAERLSKDILDGRQRRPILAPVDLELPTGAFVALGGPSGAGKSTLLAILAACDDDYRGRLSWEGRDLRTFSAAARTALRRRDVALVFQSANLVGHLSVLQNVLLPARFAGHVDAEMTAQALALLAELDLTAVATTPGRHLSGGEGVRVALARALLRRPRLLLCDEPTGALDAANRARVVALLQRCHRAGSSLLVATHDAALAALADAQLRLSPP